MTYTAAGDRYETLEYRRAGNSGLDLPAFSFGLWQKFGTDHPFQTQRDIVLRAFDLGITHFDNADRYGPPHRAQDSAFLSPDVIDDTYRQRASALNDLAVQRGQSLAQLALQWVLRQPQVTSALIGASSTWQLEHNVKALDFPALTEQELALIDEHGVHGTGLKL